LYRGDQLQLAENWAREHARDIDELEAEFLAASRVARRSRRRVRIGLGSLLGLLLVVALVMSGFAYNGQRQARAQQHTAVARELVQRADALRDKAPQLALMLGIAADHVDHTRSTTAAMLESLLTPYLGTLSASSVTAVEYSADGRLLAAADMDNRVTLWNENRKLGHLVSAFAPDALAFSSDGRTLAVGGPGSAAFWDISDAARPRRIADLGGIGAVTNVVFSPDGRLLATMNGVDHTAAVWDVGEQPHPRRLSDVNGDTDVGYDAAFSPDGRLLATTGKSQAALWDVSAPERPQRLAALPAAATTGIFSVAFRPDGRVLATDDDTAVNLWDVTDPVQPKRTYRLTDAQDNIAQVRFTAAGDMVYAATASDALCSWTLAEPARIRGWACTAGKGHRSRKALNPAVLALASGNATDNTITLWGGADSTWWLPLQTAQRHSAVGNVEFSGDGRLLATRQADGTATLWDSDGNRRRFIPVVSFPSDTVKALVLSADRTLVTLDRQGGIALWDASDPHRPVTRARLDTEGIRYSAPLASNSRRRMLAVHGQESAVQLWDISDPRKAQRRGIIPADDREVRSVTFSPDGRTLAVGGGDGRVALWDVADPGRPRRRGRVVGQDGGSIRSLAFSPDGRTLASGGAAATVTLWDVGDRDDPQLLGAPLSHRGGDIRALGFSPDGRLVAAGAGDELNLWDVSDPVHPRVVLTDTTHRAPVRTVAFSSDGRTLASGSDDMSIQIRDLTHISETRENAHELACARTGRGLNPAEWRQYIPSLPFQRTCPNPPE
ncbi:MAG: WD40 repeat domain-containing protein, partial [Mycobacteriaceae bacterium]|nr:WD40 repeat domain-containing protein [Mycobacteriaceae bacterium]